MPRMLKVYETDASVLKSIQGVRIVQKYPAFLLVEAPDDAAADAVGKAGLTEDVTNCYAVDAGDRRLDTDIPRVQAAGINDAHPSYQGLAPLPAGKHHYIVQFIGPVRPPWLAAVKRTGADVAGPYQGYAIIARATARQAGAIAELKAVRWVGHLPYAARISPDAIGPGDQVAAPAPETPRTRLLPGAYAVQFFSPERATAARGAVRKLGFKVIDDVSRTGLLIVQSKKSEEEISAQIDALSRVHGVQQIDRQAIDRISNDRAAVVMGTASALAMPALGLSGRGEIIGICDTGLDNGDPATIHPDFAGRVKAIKSYAIPARYTPYIDNPGGDDGPADIDSGHGTHTSGSILGSGAGSSNLAGLAGPIRGLSYNAELVMQAVEQRIDWKPRYLPPDGSRFSLAGIPADLAELFSWAYAKGARIHSNSWGGGDPKVYGPKASQVDQFVWDNPDFCILFAAGNDGKDRNGDGVIEEGSVTPPGTAKNCITVGASANDRPGIQQTNGDLWGPGAAPTAALAAGDPAIMAPFSSRGPAGSGRIKPDIVAPGTYILSTRSRRLGEKTWGYGRYSTASLYMYDCGTSMATPLTAGAVGVVREYLRTVVRIASPSAALLKAAMIAGAVPMKGLSAPPDNHQGFGRVNVDAIVAPRAPLKTSFVEGPKLATGKLDERVAQLVSAGHPLKIVLAYTDYPGDALVNNLNLIVHGPDGSVHIGNAPDGVASFDSTNNVERVLIAAAVQGAWRIQVVGSNVPNGPQPFALVISAAT